MRMMTGTSNEKSFQRSVKLSGLRVTLENIEKFDTAYEVRYPLVFAALSLALDLGMTAGIRIDPSEPAWPVAYIDLPTGQVSWHLPEYVYQWDGHDTAEKYRRIREFVNTVTE